MKNLRFDKRMSLEEFLESDELKRIYSGYSHTALDRYKRNIKKIGNFIGAYVVPVDPRSNFGRPFKLYTLIETKGEGLSLFKEVSAISSITNQPFRRVNINKNNIELTNEYYDRDKRSQIAATGMVMCLGI